ncbi:MAG: helix-turn-helix domain-containing protein [Gemmatimonadaceae bacterium]|nr:helix-turn-helix domain-containing protein [Gemmatimonadaceae bacterium]
MDLLAALRRPEGKTLEFKRDLSSPDGVLRTIVAFSNTAGGIIMVGVEDGTRHVRGVSDPIALEERLASLISDSITPRLLPDLEILTYRTTHVVAVQVFPSPSRPHYITKTGVHGGTYVRVGSTNRRADDALINEMKRFARGEAFDEQTMPELDSEAIDFRVASELFAPVRRLARRDVETLRLVDSHQGRKVPTIGGIILFGTNRLRHFPDAWIQVGRFKGTDRATIVDHAELRGPLLQGIVSAIEFVEKHSTRGAEIGRVRRIERWSLPPVAVREAVINAVAHADYSQRGAPIRVALFDDRLEVENPGLLPFGLTIADLPLGVSKLRNRVIGRVFHELGLVEQWGSGIQRMIAACRDAGLAPPALEEIGIRFRVTIRTERVGAVELDPIDRAIVALVTAPDGLATREIASGIGLTPRATRTRLAALVARGLVREIGTSPQDPKRRYFTTESS